MTKTAVVFTCAHADPKVSNERFDWLGALIYDLRPDYVVDLGDAADMRSLNSYDTRYPQAVVSQSYEADIETYNDAQERLRWRFRHHKRRKPKWFGFEGNHEHRIKKAVDDDPRREGAKYGISFTHLQTDHWFDEYHEYENSGPAKFSYDGILYSHYISGGNYGTAISGKHHAYSLVSQVGCSVTVGHSHKYSNYYHGAAYPYPLIGLVAGCFKGKKESWAGQANDEWRAGVVIKRDIENGVYDEEWVSLSRLKKEYGG